MYETDLVCVPMYFVSVKQIMTQWIISKTTV